MNLRTSEPAKKSQSENNVHTAIIIVQPLQFYSQYYCVVCRPTIDDWRLSQKQRCKHIWTTMRCDPGRKRLAIAQRSKHEHQQKSQQKKVSWRHRKARGNVHMKAQPGSGKSTEQHTSLTGRWRTMYDAHTYTSFQVSTSFPKAVMEIQHKRKNKRRVALDRPPSANKWCWRPV